MTIGAITENNGKLVLPAVFDEKVELMPCRACADQKKPSTAVLNRLLKDAKDKGAQNVTPEELSNRYGIPKTPIDELKRLLKDVKAKYY
jgi:hypothetical protein